MSAIKPGQGAIKLSEVALDEDASLTVIASAKNTDATTVVQQLRSTIADALQKNALVITSSGALTWDGTVLSLNNQNIQMRFLASESGAAYTHVMTASGVNGATTFSTLPIASGEILYVEYSRALANSNLVLENAVSGGSGVPGKTVKKGTTIPALRSPPLATSQGTICVPVAINVGGALYWVGSGIVWGAGTTTLIGQTSSAGQSKDQNYLINGGFDYAQRVIANTPAGINTSTSYVAADRWRFSTDIAFVGMSAFHATSQSPPNNMTRNSAGIRSLTINGNNNGNVSAVTVTGATDLVNLTAHGLASGTGIKFIGLTGSGISDSLNYFVVNPTSNNFQISASPGGTAIDITSDGSGTVSKPYSGLVANVQRIESISARSLLGKTVSVSFWYKAPAISVSLTLPSKFKLRMASAAAGYDNFSSTGADWGPSQEVEVITDGAWHQVKFENIAIDSNAFTGIELDIEMRDWSALPGGGTGSSASVYFTQCMLNEGSTASSFRPAGGGHAGDELLLCKRYYQKSYPVGVIPGVGVSDDGSEQFLGTLGQVGSYERRLSIKWGVPMRTTPNNVVYDLLSAPNAFTALNSSAGILANGLVPVTRNLSETGLVIGFGSRPNGFTGFYFHWTSDAEL